MKKLAALLSTQILVFIAVAQSPIATISYTTNNPGCNPSQETINGALGTAVINSNSCGNVTLTVNDGAVQVSECMRTQTRSWTATDECGNFATATRTISWTEDLVPPTIAILGGNNYLGCNPTATTIDDAFGTATANDDCGYVLLSQSDGLIISSGCNRSQTRTWTAVDECGNSFVTGRTVTWIEDNIPPVFNPVSNISQSPDPGLFTATVNIITPTVTDNCGGGTIYGTRSDNEQLNDPYPLGQTSITWVATDACGNVTTIVQIITIGDTQAPIINLCPEIPVQCFKENSVYSVPELSASDNWGIGNISFVITGATSREGTSNNASGIFNPGLSIINWTVEDLAGNTAFCSSSVIIDKVDVTIPDSYATNIIASIGSPNTIYIGYGGSSIILNANVLSTVDPNSFSYKWTTVSPGGTVIGTSSSITVGPSATTTYFVSVKDVNDCKPISQITKQVNVVDIRCGNGKVWVCEKQKNGGFKSICISDSKVSELPAGSYLGQCTNEIMKYSVIEKEIDNSSVFRISVAPNPSSTDFELRIESAEKSKPILMRTFDITGKIVEIKNIITGQPIKFGLNYKPGIFVVELRQGEKLEVVKIVKAN
jgi:hypothetical protein